MSEYAYAFHRVPMVDTGIGQSLGYESDAAFLEHQRAEESKLAPDVREALQKHRKVFTRSVLYGADA